MKAIDYARKFHEYVATPPQFFYEGQPADFAPDLTDFAFLVCSNLASESLSIIKARKAQTDSAILAVFRELNQKWLACVRLLAQDGYDVSTEAFRAYVCTMTPTIATGLGW